MGVPEVPASLRSWMSAVRDIARSVNAAEPLASVLTRVADQACELIGFEFCAVMLADERRGWPQVARCVGVPHRTLGPGAGGVPADPRRERPPPRLPGPGQRRSGAAHPAARSRPGYPGRPCLPG